MAFSPLRRLGRSLCVARAGAGPLLLAFAGPAREGRARTGGGGWLAGSLVVLFAALALLFTASLAHAEPKFPPLTGRVVDGAHLLSPQAKQKLEADLAGLEQQTGRQVVVATVPDLQGYDIADYGYQLGRAWGIGQKGEDNGVVFLVAPNERKVRIEVGYGLEPVLTDALSSIILQQKVLPQFRAGRMEQGVVDGVEAVIQQLAIPDDQARAKVAEANQLQQRRGQQDGGGASIGAIIAILVVVWVLGSMLRGFGGRGAGSGGLWWLLPILMSGGGRRDRWGGGGWGGGGGGGGFSGGGGSFGGGGSSGSW